MSNDMLNDDELDAVAGGTNIVMTATKTPPAYSTTSREQRSTPDKPKTFSDPAANYYASRTSALGSLRPRGTP